MFACPNCQTRLAKQPSPEGPRWLCGACGGRAIHLPSLRCTPAGAFVRRLWALARGVPAADRKRACPVCDRLMAMGWGTPRTWLVLSPDWSSGP